MGIESSISDTFKETELKIVAFLAKQGSNTSKSLSVLLNMNEIDIINSLKVLEDARWVEKIDDSHYQISFLKIFSHSMNDIVTDFAHMLDQENDFIEQTSSSLIESMNGANQHLTNSMNTLISETSALNKKLQEELDISFNKYDSNRLRSFGTFRINTDSYMRGVKEEIIRSIRGKLGFTPTGEVIFKEIGDIPAMPSALSIAETMNNTRGLLKRGFKEIDVKNKEISFALNDSTETAINELLNDLNLEYQTILDENIEGPALKKELFFSFVDKFHSDTIENMNTNRRFCKEKLVKTNTYLSEINQQLELKLTSSLNNLLSKEKTLFNELVDSLSTLISQLDEDIQKVKGKDNYNLTDLEPILKQDLVEFNKLGKNLLEFNNKQLKENVSFSQNVSEVLSDLLKNKQNTEKMIGQIVKSSDDFDKQKLLSQELHSENAKFSLLIKEGKNIIDSYTDNSSNSTKEFTKLMKLLEAKEKVLNTKEDEMGSLIQRLFHSELEYYFKIIQGKVNLKILEVGNDFLLANKDFESNIATLKEDIISKVQESFKITGKEFDEFSMAREHEYNNEVVLVNKEYNRVRDEFQDMFDTTIKDLTKTSEKQHKSLIEGVDKLKNLLELKQAKHVNEITSFFESMSISIISLVNNLENKLGEEYESLLNYFEQRKETTLGTAKTLLDSIGSSMSSYVDKIWTTTLTELNLIQEKTDVSTCSRYSKNIAREMFAKIDSAVKNRIKMLDTATEMLQNSAKFSFEELTEKITSYSASHMENLEIYREISKKILEIGDKIE